MAESARLRLDFSTGDGTMLKNIYNVNPAATNEAMVKVGKALEQMQKHTLTALSKTITTDLDLTAEQA